MVKEYRQIDKWTIEGKPVVTPIDPEMLYYEDKRKVLEVVNLIREKRNRIINGITCADDS